jgi:cobalt/nickel transport protein
LKSSEVDLRDERLDRGTNIQGNRVLPNEGVCDCMRISCAAALPPKNSQMAIPVRNARPARVKRNQFVRMREPYKPEWRLTVLVMVRFMVLMSIARPYLLSFWLCFWAHIAAAHETWIAPNVYWTQPGASILFDIRNGQHFSGASLPWLDWWIERFVAVEGPVQRPLTGRLGDIPASRISPISEGLMVVGLQSTLDRHTWTEWEAFRAFVTSKGLSAVLDEHGSRGLQRAGFVELYQRYLKTLIGIGSGSGNDRALGFELEFVALTNPYGSDFSGVMSILLLESGAPLHSAPVTIFQRNSTGRVVESRILTNEYGIVHFLTQAGSQYLLDSVTMRSAPVGASAAWFTRWASITFSIRDYP